MTTPIPITDPGRCEKCKAAAIKWNPHNEVMQCHNCGQVVDFRLFTLTVEGVMLYNTSSVGEELRDLIETTINEAVKAHPGGYGCLLPGLNRVTFALTKYTEGEDDDEGN